MGRSKKETPEEVAGAPLWMVTFSDCMNLLLTFFVLLVTFSEFGEEQQDRIMNMGSAMRSVFGTPMETAGSRNESSMVPSHQMISKGQPQYGSETPTDTTSAAARNGALKEDLQAADYHSQKVFLIPSRKVFLGRGKALSPEGRYVLGVMAAFLKETSGTAVVCENGPQEQAGAASLGLPRASAVIEYLVAQNLDRQRFGVAAESLAPPEEANGSAPTYHRQERMLEIVLLEGSVQR